MVMLRFAVAETGVGVSLSVTLAVKLYGPAVVGVPVIAPVLVFRLRPVGRLPALMLQVYGPTPPDEASVWLYAVLAIPLTSDDVVTVNAAGGFTVTVNCWLDVNGGLAESFTFTVNVPLPPVGVPEIVTELLVLDPMVIPAGRVPEDMLHANGLLPPLMLIVAE
jgi:hypothetical protein